MEIPVCVWGCSGTMSSVHLPGASRPGGVPADGSTSKPENNPGRSPRCTPTHGPLDMLLTRTGPHLRASRSSPGWKEWGVCRQRGPETRHSQPLGPFHSLEPGPRLHGVGVQRAASLPTWPRPGRMGSGVMGEGNVTVLRPWEGEDWQLGGQEGSLHPVSQCSELALSPTSWALGSNHCHPGPPS